ncbi:hypothetical protein FB451DRAFT_1188264 [Mycena latifolia]|nr:hypothetical protein FB451DRAFT_1188264 [Mycena latifolia]
MSWERCLGLLGYPVLSVPLMLRSRKHFDPFDRNVQFRRQTPAHYPIVNERVVDALFGRDHVDLTSAFSGNICATSLHICVLLSPESAALCLLSALLGDGISHSPKLPILEYKLVHYVAAFKLLAPWFAVVLRIDIHIRVDLLRTRRATPGVGRVPTHTVSLKGPLAAAFPPYALTPSFTTGGFCPRLDVPRGEGQEEAREAAGAPSPACYCPRPPVAMPRSCQRWGVPPPCGVYAVAVTVPCAGTQLVLVVRDGGRRCLRYAWGGARRGRWRWYRSLSMPDGAERGRDRVPGGTLRTRCLEHRRRLPVRGVPRISVHIRLVLNLNVADLDIPRLAITAFRPSVVRGCDYCRSQRVVRGVFLHEDRSVGKVCRCYVYVCLPGSTLVYLGLPMSEPAYGCRHRALKKKMTARSNRDVVGAESVDQGWAMSRRGATTGIDESTAT